MFLIISGRHNFIARWRSPIEQVGASLVVCAAFSDVVADFHPQMVVLDVASLPSGWAPPDSRLTAVAGKGKILLAGRDFSIEEELKALASGVSGCCAESLGDGELKNVVEVVLRGGIWVSRGALPPLLHRLQALGSVPSARSEVTHHGDVRPADVETFESCWAKLTGREREIARQVAEGASNKVIARHLDLSDATIKAHLTAVFHKLGVSNRLQLGLLLSGKGELMT